MKKINPDDVKRLIMVNTVDDEDGRRMAFFQFDETILEVPVEIIGHLSAMLMQAVAIQFVANGRGTTESLLGQMEKQFHESLHAARNGEFKCNIATTKDVQ